MNYYNQSKGVERNQIYFLMARMSERRRQKMTAIKHYTRYLQSPDRNKLSQVFSSFRLAELNQSLKRSTEAMKWHQTTLRLYRKLQTGTAFSAQSQFWLSEKIYKKFMGFASLQILNSKLKPFKEN